MVGAVLLVALALYAERGPIGAQLTNAYLRKRGIPAQIVFDRLGPSGFTAHGFLGPPGDPDLTVERAVVEFEPVPLLRGGSLVPRVRSIRLVRPQLKARLVDGRLNFGTLQSLVDEAVARPGVGPGPAVAVEAGEMRLSTPAGDLHMVGDGALDGGRLTRLSARLAPTTLRNGDLRAEIAAARMTARAQGGRLVATLNLAAPRLAGAGAALADVRADVQAALPYPAPGLTGPLQWSLSARAGQFEGGATRVAELQLTASFDGMVDGPLQRTAMRGSGRLALASKAWRAPGAAGDGFSLAGGLSGLGIALTPEGARAAGAADLSGEFGPIRSGALQSASAKLGLQIHALDGLFASGRGTVTATPQITVSSRRLSAGAAILRNPIVDLAAAHADLSWGRGGWSLAAPLRLRARAADLTQPLPNGAFTQRAVDLQLGGDARIGSIPPRLALQGSFRSGGGGASPAAARRLAEAIPVISTDPAGRAAVERALQSVRIAAPSVALRIDPSGAAFRLPTPIALIGPGDARVTLAAPRTDSLTLKLAGAGLPEVDLGVSGYRFGQDRGGLTFAGDTRLALKFSGSTMGGAVLDLSGRTVRRAGVLTVSAPRCGAVALASFGEAPKPLVTDLKADACADGDKPLFSLGPGAWSLHSRLAALQLKAPDSESAVRGGAVLIDLFGDARSGQPAGSAEVLGGRIIDVAAIRRFEPLSANGRVDLIHGVWTGPVQLSNAAKARPVAQVQVTHVMETRVGHADISAPSLTFEKDGLQPRDLSPVGADLVSDVEGGVAFTGRADWGTGALTSSGRLTASGVNFRSPLGLVKQARADIALTSLAPLLSAPDQAVGAQEIAWIIPLTAPSAAVTLKADRTGVAGAAAGAAKGRVTLDPIDLPFDRTALLSGVVRLDGVDIATLIDRFNLADKVTLEAVIAGALPFRFENGALRLTNGRIYATGPGRLTIRPEALTGASASAPGAPPPQGGMQTFAYQALEDLAFDKLEAEVGSQPMGRLGVLFRINGRHDPPKGGDTRIGLIDLLRGRAFDKPIDLPKGTPVNLTLDTSLNLDELLAAYAGRDRSDPVQPPAAKP